MRIFRLYNELLWVTNAALGAFIIPFLFKYLLHPADYTHDVRVEDWREAGPFVNKVQLPDHALKLRNPIALGEDGAPVAAKGTFSAILKGTLPREQGDGLGTAFLKSMASNAELVAYVGEKILFEAKEFREYSGWTLEQVWKDRARFNGPNGRTQELTIETDIPGSSSKACFPGRVTR